MKTKIKIMIFLFGICQIGKSQNYESIFGSESTSWTYLSYHGTIGENTIDSLTVTKMDTNMDYIRIKLDLYSKSISGDQYFFLDSLEMDYYDDNSLYLNANDVVNNTLDTFLLYTDILSVGDSIKYESSYNIVDSLYLVNNKKHIRLENSITNGYNIPLLLIEGVISNQGPFWNACILPNSGEYVISHLLLCQHKNDTLSYVNDHPIYGGNCSPYLGIEDVSYNEIKMYPNPVINFIHLSDKYNNERYIIYDPIGNEVISGVIYDNTINVISLNKGLYFGKVITKDKTYNSFKFIKE